MKQICAAITGTLFIALATVACTNNTSGTSTAPSDPKVTYQAQQLNSGVTSVLEDDYQANNVEDVDCPAASVLVGAFIRCTATIAGGHVYIDLTVIDANGRYKVGRPHEH